jgi:hypothetical protein
MNLRLKPWLFVAFVLFVPFLLRAELIRIAAYNLENYLDQPTETRRFVKSPEAKAKIRESIRALKPDVISLEEMGSTNALLELRASLKAEGLDFPYWEHVSGFDTNIHVALLSRFPITARRPHTNENFLLDGRRFSVSRGFLEVRTPCPRQVRRNCALKKPNFSAYARATFFPPIRTQIWSFSAT